MRLIISRKGFDSSAGGCPSPVFEDGTICSLPIPDKTSNISYGELKHSHANIGELVRDLTRNLKRPIIPEYFAHLDPHVDPGIYPGPDGWRPLLGQRGNAQNVLQNHGVGKGDLFLFFGLFREVEKDDQGWTFRKTAPLQHIFWGWLQIDEVVAIKDLGEDQLMWARYHPHLQQQLPTHQNDTLYIAAEKLTLNGRDLDIPGAGVFDRRSSKRILTNPDGRVTSEWRLPRFLFPEEGRTPLGFHGDMKRWSRDEHHAYLKATSPGQEFVLDVSQYPETLDWLQDILVNER